MRWPTIIGGAVASVGSGSVVAVGAHLYIYGIWSSRGWADELGSVLVLVASALLAALSYFLFRARNWARLALIGLCLCLAVGIALSVCSDIFFLGVSGVHVQGGVLASMSTLGLALGTTSIPVWFALMLRHPDVARDFTSNTTSNPYEGCQR